LKSLNCKNHPDTLRTANNLAVNLPEPGEHVQARALARTPSHGDAAPSATTTYPDERPGVRALRPERGRGLPAADG
jgi:hypothetical protein